MTTKTKTTAREEITQAAEANGWTVTDLGEVTYRTPSGSFGREGVTHVTQAIQIDWPEKLSYPARQPRFLVFFKSSGAFNTAVEARETWEDIQRIAEDRATSRVAWYHKSNEEVAQACAAHGVEIGVSFPKRKGMVTGLSGYRSIQHQIVNDGKEYLVLAPYSEEYLAGVKAQSVAEETYKRLGQSKLTKTDLLRKLGNSPAAVAERRQAAEAEREARLEAQRQEREAANRAKEQERSAERTRLQGEVYRVITNAAASRLENGRYVAPEPREIATEVVMLLQQEDSPLVALVDAWRAHKAAEAGVRADRLEREALAAKAARNAEEASRA